jgi:hypothetical protein
VDSGGELEEGTHGASLAGKNQRLLAGQCPLGTATVVWNDRYHGDLERPLDLRSTVVVASVKLVDDECSALGIELQMVMHELERGAGPSEPDEVRGGYQEDLFGGDESGAIDGGLGTDEVTAHI